MGKKSKKYNENFIHNCNETQVRIKDYAKSILEMGFTSKEIIEILDFYLFHAPILKNEKTEDKFGFKSLKYYNWYGNKLSKLEGLLLKESGIGNFCIIKADSIENTLDAMNLNEKCCVFHPRAVIKQNYNVKVNEDGSINISEKETRMECLFRHIRNAIAHNHTYFFENDYILLEDLDEEKNVVTARILFHKKTLDSWIKVIKGNNI